MIAHPHHIYALLLPRKLPLFSRISFCREQAGGFCFSSVLYFWQGLVQKALNPTI